MKKEILILNISKSIAELDWMLPVMSELKNKYKIFVLFQKRNIYKSLSKDRVLFSLFNELDLECKFDSLFDKFLRFIDKKFTSNLFLKNKIKIFFKFNIKKYFSKKKIDIFQVQIFFSEFGTYSSLIDYLKLEKNRPKIIHFPTSSHIFQKPLSSNEPIRYSLKGDFLLISNDYDLEFWSQFIKKENIKVVGVPKYDSKWLNKIIFKQKKNFKNTKKIILIAYSSMFGMDKRRDIELTNQLKEMTNVFSKFPEMKFIFKIHPRKNNPYYLKILNEYKNFDYEILSDNLLSLTEKCNIFLHDRYTSVLSDGLIFKKPCIEYWCDKSDSKSATANDTLKLNIRAKDESELENLLRLAINDPSNKLWIDQIDNFNSHYKKFKDIATKRCLDTINELINIK